MKISIRFIHFLIYGVLITGFISACYMVFVVYRPIADGAPTPLWDLALKTDHAVLMERRLYALEAWVIFGFLSLYFSQTTFKSWRLDR